MQRILMLLIEKFALVALILLSLLLSAISISRLIYPFDVGHLEACTWRPALMSASGHNPYAFAAREPFVMAPYGYFYYLTVGIGLRMFGAQFWFGRALSIVAAVVCVVCVARLAWLLTLDRRATWLATLTFLSAITLHHWIGVHRPDLPALALACVALTLVFATDDEADRINRQAILVVVLLTIMFFLKQTTLLPIGVAIARYLQTGRRRVAAFALCGMLSLGVAIAVALNATSGSGYFWQHFTLAGRIPHSYADAMHWLLSLFKSPSFWIAVGLIGGSFWSATARRRFGSLRGSLSLRSPDLLIHIWLVASFVFGVVTSARRGAYINYYLEASIAGSIAVAVAWRRLTERKNHRRLYLSVVSLLTLAGAFEFSRMARAESYRWRSLDYYREVVRTVARETPPQSLVISNHPELAVAAGQDYHFGDWFQYQDGRSAKLQEIYAAAISSKRYAAIILLNDNADLSGYHLARMRQTTHEKYFPVFLYLRNTNLSRER